MFNLFKGTKADKCIRRAASQSKKGDHSVALKELEKGLVIGPANVSLKYNKAVCLAELEKIDAATELYEQLFSTDKEGKVTSVGHFNLGNIHRRRERLDEAIAEYEHALEGVERLDTNQRQKRGVESNCYCWLGLCYLAKRDLDGAKSSFQVALRIDPDNSTAQRNLERLS